MTVSPALQSVIRVYLFWLNLILVPCELWSSCNPDRGSIVEMNAVKGIIENEMLDTDQFGRSH